MSWDPDLDLEHGVLRNRLTITDPAALATAEATLTAVRIADIERNPIAGRYDLAHLQHFHYVITFDVYYFGGRLRTVRLGKGGQPFCPPEQITTEAARILDRRADAAHLRRLDRDEAVADLAALMGGLLWLHPFREVNGRAIRVYLRQLAAHAGWDLSWADLDRDRNRDASRAAHDGDLAPLRALLDDRLTAAGPGRSRQVTP